MSAPPPQRVGVPRQAMVLAAGLGTRLRPLSDDRAKPAMPVCGEPLIRRILRWLASAGVTEAVLNLHHRPETVAAAVGEGRDLGVRVRYSWEQPVVLGSAGGPRLALPLIEADPFVLVNGDTLTDVDLAAMSAAHRASGALVTMAVVPHPDPARYGGVLAGPGGDVRGFTGPDPSAGAWHFVGVQLASRSAFETLTPGVPEETVRRLYPALIARQPGCVRIFATQASFRDIGTPADYLAASLAVAAADGGRALPAGRDVRIAADARVERSILWDAVTVGAGSQLVECIVGDGVTIPPGSRFTRAAIVRARRAPAAGERRDGDLLIADLGPAARTEPASHQA
ncbi:MAG: NDP-sugar synthase [Acidobacteriota bacterium]|nr:NDP-sugar synthase [Acidobacteriota bacterium]